MAIERVTVTLPAELIAGIDRLQRNRSRFIAEAIMHELERRRQTQLRQSLMNPHPESGQLEDEGFETWAASLLAEDAEGLVDPAAGTAVRWDPGTGWTSL